MLGLFGNLDMAARALQANSQGMEVAGHNLANVNNPAYARQRVTLQTSLPLTDPRLGAQGTGADITAITQIRDTLLDEQIRIETSARGALDAEQQGLQYAQAGLGQEVNTGAAGANGTAAAGGITGQNGLATRLAELFKGFQGLATDPTSLSQRQVLAAKAQDFTAQLNQTATRLSTTRATLNSSLQSDVAKVNTALSEIAQLNGQILNLESGRSGAANDLRDLRQQKIEALSTLTKTTLSPNARNSLDLEVGGVTLVSGNTVQDTLETYDAGGGQMLVRTVIGGTAVTPNGGRLQGTIDARDNGLAALQTGLDDLAAGLATEVNAIYRPGFGLDGSTGQNFFTGTTAATLAVSTTVTTSPASIQAAAVAGAVGDNQVALALAQLADKKVPSLGNQTISQHYSKSVGDLGQALASVNSQVANQSVVQKMLGAQRESVSGVSLDEEMTDMMKFQHAYQASARIINIIDSMLQTAIGLGAG